MTEIPVWAQALKSDLLEWDEQGCPVVYSTPENNWVAPMPTLVQLDLLGDDRLDFLQGQTTNDLKSLAPGQCQLSAICTPKGRVRGTMYILAREDRYSIFLPDERAKELGDHLGKMGMLSGVTVKRPEVAIFGIGLSQPDDALQIIGDPPLEPGQSRHSDPGTYLRISRSRLLVLTTPAEASSTWEALVSTFAPAGLNEWELISTQEGEPGVQGELVEAFTPQMLNLHALDAVNFTKGCYVGQEIVARTRYLGNLKRHSFRLAVATERIPELGSEVQIGTDSVGTVTRAARTVGGTVEVLAVLPVEGVESGVAIQIGGIPAEVLELPYTVEIAPPAPAKLPPAP